MMFEDKIDYWHLADELTVEQATLLILNANPSTPEAVSFIGGINDFETISKIIKNAVSADQFRSRKVYTEYHAGAEIHWGETVFSVDDLKEWLSRKGFTNNFFFPKATTKADYLDKTNPNYAPKLAAAIHAWIAVTSETSLLEGKTPKHAIDKWLRQHANEYGLTKDDGSPNESAIDEISKNANWKPEGGASKTPTTKAKPTLGKQEAPAHVSKNLPTH